MCVTTNFLAILLASTRTALNNENFVYCESHHRVPRSQSPPGRVCKYSIEFSSFPDFAVALNGTYNLTRSADYPTTIEIGPSFFESHTTWPGVKFSHGFNLGGNNGSRRWDTLLQTVPLACEALGKERFYFWEYGNEPDLLSTNTLAPVRSAGWNESDYVAEWFNSTYGYIAPSFAGTDGDLKAPIAWADGLDADGDISSHKYVESPLTGSNNGV
ncbi:hypothetical protein F4775DRAFT_591026 [Biscogniauxia sp. FL1348]|nr:hypothetical protein F4775DRAFT_591026 [Biscogniauxia sp. FL1348]